MSRIKNLSIDIETFSSENLAKCGVYRYAESPDFEILLFGYSVGGEEVNVIDLATGERIPDEITEALTDESVKKWAFNAAFERVCLSRFLGLPEGEYLDSSQWRCSMVWSAYMGLPLSLEGVGAVLGLEKQKMTEGKDLIRYFCVPCKPTKTNGGRLRNLPGDAPEKWKVFKEYNKRDVETELSIKERLGKFPVPEFIWDEYHLDQEINDRGIMVDMPFVREAIRIDSISREKLIKDMKGLTALENPNSVAQMKTWLSDRGVEVETLGKKEVKSMLDVTDGDVNEALSLRLQIAKSSVKKYQAMESAVCRDGRCRGMFRFYGANRTGRFSSHIIQWQNLARNEMSDLEYARSLVRSGNTEALSVLYDNIPDVLSQLIRTAFIPTESKMFYVADFSAIEARVLAWLAGEQWVLDVFSSGKDLYCETASRMFGVPVEKHGINGDLRQKGKQATLSCIAEGQLVLTDRGLVPIEEVTLLDKLWDGEKWVNHDGVIYKGEREVITYEGLTATPEHLVYVENREEPMLLFEAVRTGSHLVKTTIGETSRYEGPAIAKVYDILNAGRYHRFTVSGHLVHNCGYGGGVGALKAMGAIEAGMKEEELQPLVDAWRASNPNIVKLWWNVDRAVKKAVKERTVQSVNGISFSCSSGMLFVTLPSGRKLSYVKPRIEENKFGGESVTYEGIGATKKWERLESFGGRWVENIIQAISRDILLNSMKTLRNMRIVAHVHDELIIEADPDTSLEEICRLMAIVPEWAEGLVLRADGYTCEFYKKD